MKRLLISTFLICGLTILAQAQSDFDYDDSDPFEVRQLTFSILDSNQIKSLLKNKRIQSSKRYSKNIICYQDSFSPNSEEQVYIAYNLKNKNHWISFPVPFHDITYDYRLINFDNKGQPELVTSGIIQYDGWPRGYRYNGAIMIFNLDSIPTQIFKLFNGCIETNIGGPPTDEGAYEVEIERKVKIKDRNLHIESITYDTTNENNKYVFKEFCHFTDIQPGTYKLLKGKFIKQ